MFHFSKKIATVILGTLFVLPISYAETIDRSGFISNIRELKEISDVIDIILSNHVTDKDINKKILMQGAINGMVNALDDPHSNYFDEQEFKDFKEDINGKYVGVGMVIQKKENEALLVVSPIEDTPAYKAGIKPGDKILEINGESVYKFTTEECSKRLRGKKNTKVKIKVFREANKTTKDIEIVRKEITLKYVKHKMLNDNIGYLRITQFGENIFPDAKAAVKEMLAKGMQGLIIDLRSNPGGEIGQAVKVASMFIKEGKIVSTKAKHGKEQIYDREGEYFGDFPLVILINEGSASASEIVAGAIKDYNRGKLIGTKSFGKGSVQTLITLPDRDGIKLTIAKYYTPNGNMIHGKGIEPDIKIEDKDYYLISDSVVTNVDEKETKKDKKEKIRKILGEKEAKKVDKHKDIQLEKAKEIILNELKKSEVKKGA